jgi:predicted TIM-barrel enzyme
MITNRKQMIEKLHAKIRTGEPIIGGGAGTGISAKFEEAGGIDLIVIYNSGRFRMSGHGSLAGLLAYGDANAIVMEMSAEVLPVVKHTPVIAAQIRCEEWHTSCSRSNRQALPACKTFRQSV